MKASDITHQQAYEAVRTINAVLIGSAHNEFILLGNYIRQQEGQAPALKVSAEIQDIMIVYREQEQDGGVDTPGGLEHMGDVWDLLKRWDEELSAVKGEGTHLCC